MMRTWLLLLSIPALAAAAIGLGLRESPQESRPPVPDAGLATRPGAFADPSAARETRSGDWFVYALQDTAVTTIHRVSPDGADEVVFSDRTTAIAIQNLEMATRLVVTVDGRLFAYGRPRVPGEADFFPRGRTIFRTEAYRTYVYELSTDGSNTVRRIAEVLGTQSPRRFLVSPRGDRIAYFNVEWERDEAGVTHTFHWIHIHDTRTGERVRQVDARLREYDNFRGAVWLDDSRIYLWRIPVVEEHLAEDQDTTLSIGPHVIDVVSGTEVRLDPTPFLTMLSEVARRQEDAAPICGTRLDDGALACVTTVPAERGDSGCRAIAARVFRVDPERADPALLFTTTPNCAAQWFVSPDARWLAGVESLTENYAPAGRVLWLWDASREGSAPVRLVATGPGSPTFQPVGWVRR